MLKYKERGPVEPESKKTLGAFFMRVQFFFCPYEVNLSLQCLGSVSKRSNCLEWNVFVFSIRWYRRNLLCNILSRYPFIFFVLVCILFCFYLVSFLLQKFILRMLLNKFVGRSLLLANDSESIRSFSTYITKIRT